MDERYFDRSFLGPQDLTEEDVTTRGSRYAEVRAALFRNPYYVNWGAADEPPLPVYDVTLGGVLRGILPKGRPWSFRRASFRTLESTADLRWGPDGRGYRRLLHPNGVCLLGRWRIDGGDADYTGYFARGREALIVARYSTCCAETRRGRYRSLSIVGKLFPTTDPNHVEPLPTADFITQQDFGGEKTEHLAQLVVQNAPNTTPWRRGFGVPTLLVTGLTFLTVDTEPTIRQLYTIAELGKPDDTPTAAPEFMRLRPADALEVPGADLDFRDELLAQLYDPGRIEPKRTLEFDIEVSDRGRTRGRLIQRRRIEGWTRIGRIVFDEAVASYNGDFVLHFRHPRWRRDRNDPNTVAHPGKGRA